MYSISSCGMNLDDTIREEECFKRRARKGRGSINFLTLLQAQAFLTY